MPEPGAGDVDRGADGWEASPRGSSSVEYSKRFSPHGAAAADGGKGASVPLLLTVAIGAAVVGGLLVYFWPRVRNALSDLADSIADKAIRESAHNSSPTAQSPS
jgi:hypothetical protein